MKIADFGVSKLSPKGITEPRTNAGTSGYIAPECYAINNSTTRSNYTHAVDIWSLGCLMFVVLTEKYPFDKVGYSLLEKYCNGSIGFPESPLIMNQVSLSGRMFIQQLLAPLAEDRPLASVNLIENWTVSSVSSEVSQVFSQNENSLSATERTVTEGKAVQGSKMTPRSANSEFFDVSSSVFNDQIQTAIHRRNENNMVSLGYNYRFALEGQEAD